jgi:hypothetical protein
MSNCSNKKGCPSPVTILPFTDNTVFIDNSINIIDPINKLKSTIGNYIASSSSYFDNTTRAFNAFNNDTTFWKSNTSENYYTFPESSDPGSLVYTTPPYNISDNNIIANSNKAVSIYQGGNSPTLTNFITTTINGSSNTIAGEWLQIQLPHPIILTSYSISTPINVVGDTLNYFPSKFSVVASNDGIRWDIIDSSNNSTVSESNIPKITKDNPSVTFNLNNNSNKYLYYRLIIESMQNNVSSVRITKWNLIGFPDISETFVGNINGSYGSINQQYSYYNFYPSLNTFSNFAISEPMQIMNDDCQKKSIENSEKNYDYNKIYTGILFTLLGGTLIYIFTKATMKRKIRM